MEIRDMHKTRKLVLTIASAAMLGYLILMIPDCSGVKPVHTAREQSFAWNRDDLWNGLERNFREAKCEDSAILDAALLKKRSKAELGLLRVMRLQMEPGDSLFPGLLYNFFAMAPLIAARRCYAEWYIDYYNRLRNGVKYQSQHWDMNAKPARDVIYEVLYGMRAAVEEVLLQSPGMKFDPAMFVRDEKSATPPAKIFGITVHSGDLLVSRGGAVASALISRGNDYPGNFSHVALIYVDEKTAVPYLVEAHIEKGVAVSSVKQYIADKKLRFMVMRPRADLPQMARDPMIPHKAAAYAYQQALTRHIPYDFKMDFHDSAAMFCSEVGSSGYKHYGINLWQAISTISSPGVVRLLNEFGVENFVTLMPSDLEYDPQLSVVAEWRDPRTLFNAHLDNAVMDVMLEHAEKGEEISINCWLLPVARVVKGYSVLLNLFHRVGPIPEGMSATQGLKNNAFTGEHARLRILTEQKVNRFIAGEGYLPPYWQLVKMAKASAEGR